ncbi:MAG: 2-oxoglutarate dehydrogenase complex dihydrolipoyllysine-residue succinyltransferase [Bacteroidetes bacterium]|nr:2-oxoglutarate dehydrogenase complex dihydrolipoyllysine-residue succinyltransferase [Bacteroidota bacterium]
MMANEIIIPSPGESITQVQIAKWLVNDGDTVEKDQEVVEIDSDKASFPLASPVDGILKILISEGETVQVGTVIATVEEVKGNAEPGRKEKNIPPVKSVSAKINIPQESRKKSTISPLAEKILDEKKLNKDEVTARFSGKRVTRKDVENFISSITAVKEPVTSWGTGGSRETERKKMSPLRLKLSERLVAVKNQTALLTTFNEVDMHKVQEIRSRYNETFKVKFGVTLGFTSFFTKAVTTALQSYPQVNSMIDGTDLIIPRYVDIGIAVSAPKGLVVPVLRNAEKMSLAEIEIRIRELAAKAREGRISLDDMKGGTFTITNGGVFGSMMSTPILNPPQSAILGLHKIMDRPVAMDGKVEIRPMMYLALSYDHRVVDGSESVSFLVKIKEFIEDPVRMLTGGSDPVQLLLDIET